jgi:hypothetical protein
MLMGLSTKTIAQSDSSGTGGVPSEKQLLGIWTMIALPNKELNKVNPWPLNYQWFKFYDNGKVCSLMSSENKEYSFSKLDELFNNMLDAKTPNYQLHGQFMTIDNPQAAARISEAFSWSWVPPARARFHLVRGY